MKVLVAALLLAGAAVARAEPIELGQVRQNLFATCSPTDREGWMVGELGRIFRTTDGGVTWQRQDAGTKRPFLAMSCVDAQTAWIAGKEGVMYGTGDGGNTWRQLQTGSQRHASPSSFPRRSAARAWATSAPWSTPRTAAPPGPPRASPRT